MNMNANQIRDKLATDDRWLARGILAIAARQTADEQAGKTTRYLNGRGFNRRDAQFGCSLADWLKSGKALTPRQADAARKMMAKYAGQLERIANEKQPEVLIVKIIRPVPYGACPGQYQEEVLDTMLLCSEAGDETLNIIHDKLAEEFEIRA